MILKSFIKVCFSTLLEKRSAMAYMALLGALVRPKSRNVFPIIIILIILLRSTCREAGGVSCFGVSIWSFLQLVTSGQPMYICSNSCSAAAVVFQKGGWQGHPIEWPPLSPDLTSLNVFLRGFIKPQH